MTVPALWGYSSFRWGVTRWGRRGPLTQGEFWDSPPWDTDLEAIDNGRDQQYLVDFQGATGGTWTLTIDGNTTASLDWDATAAEIIAAIEAILGAGCVSVRGRVGLWAIRFIGGCEQTILPATLNDGSLTGTFTGYMIETQSANADTSGTVSLPTAPGEDPEDLTVVASTTQPHTIEIRDADNDLVREVEGFFDTRMYLKTDEAAQFTFKVMGGNAAISDLTPPNRVVVRDAYGFAMETFHIHRRRPMRDGNATTFQCDCIGQIADLGRVVVLRHREEQTVAEHVADFLALQGGSTPISLGEIDPQIAGVTVRLDVADSSVLGAIKQLQGELEKELAGHFYVDARGVFHWKLQIGDHTGTVIAVGRGLKGVDYSEDWSDVANRVYMYGGGADPDNRVKLTDAGADLANEYYEDAASVATYGLRELVKVDRRIRKPETLLRAATRIIDELKAPVRRVEIDFIDLASSLNFDGFPPPYLGSEYTIYDPYLGIEDTVTVESIEWDLDDPMPKKLGLVNRRRTIGDWMNRMLSQLAATEVDLNDDGAQHPTFARTYSTENDSAYPRLSHKGGDILTEGGAVKVHNGSEFKLMVPLYTAAGESNLPTSPDEQYAFGFDLSTRDYYRWDGEWIKFGNVSIDTVETLPAIPTSGFRIVYCTRTSDKNLWFANEDMTEWVPMPLVSNLSGAPPA